MSDDTAGVADESIVPEPSGPSFEFGRPETPEALSVDRILGEMPQNSSDVPQETQSSSSLQADLGFDWSQPPVPAYYQPVYQSQPEGAFDRLIPAKNPCALIAYYLGVFSLIPCAAIPLGIASFILGVKGLKAIRANPNLPGSAHAWIGIILGGLMALANIAFLIFVLMNARISQ